MINPEGLPEPTTKAPDPVPTVTPLTVGKSPLAGVIASVATAAACGTWNASVTTTTSTRPLQGPEPEAHRGNHGDEKIKMRGDPLFLALSGAVPASGRVNGCCWTRRVVS